MSPFGRAQDQRQDKQQELEQWRLAARTELGRLGALPLADLATEVMTRGFGPGAPGADDQAITVGQQNANAGPTAMDISYQFVPDDEYPGSAPEDTALRQQLARLVAEGLQQLEHASLVRCQLHTQMGSLDWTATRLGRAAIERGEVGQILRAR